MVRVPRCWLRIVAGRLDSSATCACSSGGRIAWTWSQERGRRWRFLRLIRRELQEVSPHPWPPDPGRPWWEHHQKHFIHREIFDEVTENRDFILSLRPTIVYNVTQLWDAFEARDGPQWLYFLERVASSRAGSRQLRAAVPRWRAVMKQTTVATG